MSDDQPSVENLADFAARTLAELAVLDAQSSDGAYLAVVLPGGLGLPIEQGTAIVSFHSGGDPARELVQLLDRDGLAEAFVFTQRTRGQLEVSTIALPWCKDLEGTAEYCAGLREHFQSLIERGGFGKAPPVN